MIKNISLTRKEYKRAYQWLRWTKGSTHLRMFRGISQETLLCAVLTYDTYDSEFSGWSNRQRMSQFTHRRSIVNPRDWLPF